MDDRTEHNTGPDGSADPRPPFGVPLARPIGAASYEGVDGVPPDARAVVAAPAPMDLPGTSRAFAGIQLLLLVAAAALATVVAAVLGFAGLEVGLFESEDAASLPVTIAFGAFLLAGTVAIVLVTGGNAASIGITGRKLYINLPLGLLGLVLAFGLFYATAGAIYLISPATFDSMTENSSRIYAIIPKLRPLLFLFLSVWIGVQEEIVFRGFLLSRLRRLLGNWWLAILLGSILFAVPHMLTQKAVMAIPLFAIAIGWSVLTAWRRSIVPAIIAHALFDFIQFMGLYYLPPELTGGGAA